MTEESTTPDLAELLRRGAEALSRRDFDEFMSHFAQHAVWDLNARGIGTFTGVDVIRAFLEDWLGSYEEYVAEVEEGLDLGHGVVSSRTGRTVARWTAMAVLNGGRRRAPSGRQA